MKTVIYFYTGTGNSLWTARTLAEKLKDAEICPMPKIKDEIIKTESENIGIVFPVHIWGLPHSVINFINRLEQDSSKYYFAMGVNAGQVAATLLQLDKLMKSKGMNLASGFDIDMPSNYIPWGGPGSDDKVQLKIDKVSDKLAKIAALVNSQKQMPLDKGPLWQNILLSLLYKFSFNQVPKMDKNFWVDEKCNSCGNCVKVCASKNIELAEGKPNWQQCCDQCYACLQWCPQEAIQYGKNTPKYQRYQHPEVTLAEIISCCPQ